MPINYGHKLVFCSSDVNECRDQLHSCSNFAQCINTHGSFSCHCLEGYDGDGVVCSGLTYILCSLTFVSILIYHQLLTTSSYHQLLLISTVTKIIMCLPMLGVWRLGGLVTLAFPG